MLTRHNCNRPGHVAAVCCQRVTALRDAKGGVAMWHPHPIHCTEMSREGLSTLKHSKRDQLVTDSHLWTCSSEIETSRGTVHHHLQPGERRSQEQGRSQPFEPMGCQEPKRKERKEPEWKWRQHGEQQLEGAEGAMRETRNQRETRAHPTFDLVEICTEQGVFVLLYEY